MESRLKDTDYRGLRVLPSGMPPADPADLLANAAVGDVVRALRSLADVVIIDSPPAMRLVDASLLAEHADGVAIMAWEGRTDRAHLVETVEGLALNEVKVLGVIINGAKRRHPRSYTPYYVKSASSGSLASSVRRRLRPNGAEADADLDALVTSAPSAERGDDAPTPDSAGEASDTEHTKRT